MKNEKNNIRDFLYDEPGPKAKRRIIFWTIVSLFPIAFLLYRMAVRFQENGQLAPQYWSFFLKYTTWRFIGQGLLGTLELMRGRISRSGILRKISAALIEFTRGVPTLLFIYFFFLVVPQTGLKLPSLLRIALPVAISAVGVVAEVFRSGVNAVPKGQTEAALSLGMRNRHVFYKVVFPQAFRYVIPSLISEIVIVVKDTTFAYVINFPDLMQNAKVLISNYDAMLPVYLVVSVIYILINFLINQLARAVR